MDFREKVDVIINDLKVIQTYSALDVYVPQHFKIQELVDPLTFKDRGDKSLELLEPKLLWTIDQMREKFGSITINSWLWGGQYKYSGFRPKHTSVGATYSQHRLGRAFDLKFKNHTADEIRAYIKVHSNDDIFKYITCIENNTPTWVHIDCRPISDKIRWINP